MMIYPNSTNPCKTSSDSLSCRNSFWTPQLIFISGLPPSLPPSLPSLNAFQVLGVLGIEDILADLFWWVKTDYRQYLD